MMRRIAIALVGKYPQPWRDRYGDEVLELLRESPVRLSDVSELFRGLIVERARALIEDADHPKRTARILAAMQPLFALVFSLSAMAVGMTLRSWSPMARDVASVVAFAAFMPILVFVLIVFRRGAHVGWQDYQAPLFRASTGVVCLPIVFAAIALLAWAQWGGGNRVDEPQWAIAARVFNQLWIGGIAVSSLSSAFWPGRQMLVALGHFQVAEQQVRAAEKWVAGCHEVEALGMTSPLAEAEQQLRDRIRQRDDAREQLNALGYRARFERS